MQKHLKENGNITTQGTMQKSKPKVAILLAGNDAVDFAIANVIIGLKRYNEDLITNIFIYHDIKQETREKISSLWKDKIIWIPYAYEDFLKDVDYDIGEIPIPQGSRWGHFIYAKFHIFTHLKDYDYAIWLDTDILILDSIEDLLAKDIDARGINVGASSEVFKTLKFLGYNPIEQNPFKPFGAFLSFNSNILTKFVGTNAVQECFKYLKLITKNKFSASQSGTDEAPFGILTHVFSIDFDFTDIGNKVVILPRNVRNTHIIVHAFGNSKFWNYPLIFISFQEWFVNHKIWEKINGKKPLTFKPDNLGGLTSPHKLYHFLWNLNALLPLYYQVCELSVKQTLNIEIFPILAAGDRFLDVYSVFLGKNIFYRFAVSQGWQAVSITYELQIVCKNNNLIAVMENVAKINNNFTLKYNKKATGEIIDCYLTKNISTFTLEQKIQALQDLTSSTFNLFYKTIYKKDFIPYDDPVHSTIALINLKIFLESKTKEIDFTLHYGTAKQRIHNHLSYKLGKAMIENSKSILGYIRMPYVLSYIKEQHNKEQKQYQEQIKKNPNLKLPKLESYKDYKEALKEKECFTYKLGEAFIRANTLKSKNNINNNTNNISGGGGGRYYQNHNISLPYNLFSTNPLLTSSLQKKCVS